MATQYFRVTAYHPTEDLSAIFDSNGMYEKIWQLSSYLLGRGFKVIEVSGEDKFLDVNIDKAEPDAEHLLLRAHQRGKPESIRHTINGVTYRAIQVGEKIYIPDREQTGGAL